MEHQRQPEVLRGTTPLHSSLPPIPEYAGARNFKNWINEFKYEMCSTSSTIECNTHTIYVVRRTPQLLRLAAKRASISFSFSCSSLSPSGLSSAMDSLKQSWYSVSYVQHVCILETHRAHSSNDTWSSVAKSSTSLLQKVFHASRRCKYLMKRRWYCVAANSTWR